MSHDDVTQHTKKSETTMGTATPRAIVTLDQEAGLAAAATRLTSEFAGTFNAATVERFLHTSYADLADAATVVTFLPLLTEKFTRQRLRALARVEGHDDTTKPTVLFLCVHNAGRSQMALGFFQHLSGDSAIGWSGGSEPGGQLEPAVVQSMHDAGIDITGEFPKPWTDEVVQAADVVITMGCDDACPVFPGKRYEEWELADPAGLDVADVAPLRDDIERRVRRLLEELRIPVGS